MNRRAFLRLSSILLFSLLAACETILPPIETIPPRVPTQPSGAITPIAPTSTAQPPTATYAPSATPTQEASPTPNLEPILPDNAGDLGMETQFDARDASDFAWLPENQGVVLVNENGAMTTDPDRFAPETILKAAALTQFGIAPDGEHFAAVQENSRVMLGEVTAGITQTLAALPGVVTSLAFSPDSTHLAVAASDANEVVVWDTRGGVIVGNFTLPYWLSDLAIARDNSLLAGVDLTQFSLMFIDPTSGAVQNTLQWTESASPALYGAILSPDWSQVAWYARGTIQLMDTQTGELGVSLEHEDFITTIAWSPNSKLIASAAAATVVNEFLPVVILWDIVTGEQLAVLPLKSSISQLKFNPEGTQLGILTADGEFQTWTIKP